MTILEHPESGETSYEVDVYESEEAEEPSSQIVTVSEVTTKFFAKLKETAESFLGNAVSSVVVSVPAHFEEKSHKALVDSVHRVGLDTVYPISEPVAAALAFEMLQKTPSPKCDKTIAVIDLGGHQFNITLLSVNAGLYSILASLDDYQLGGVHFDEVLVDYVKAEFKKKTKFDITKNKRSLAKLRAACELTKKMLSQRDTAPCSVDSLYDGVDYHAQILRSRFEMLAEPLFQRCVELVKKTLSSVSLSADNIDEVLFVGGSSRIPRFQAVVRSLFPESCTVRNDIEPDEAVAMGCALQAKILVERASAASADAILSNSALTSAKRLTKNLGIILADGKILVVLKAKTPIPATRRLKFPIQKSDQKDFMISVVEESETKPGASDPILGILLSDLNLGESGSNAQLEVSFLVDNDLSLVVSAKETVSGRTVKARTAPLVSKSV
ncbi:hypothetical protein HDU96_000125 [Phlyctochytrium bullatum]|nr:hypothetical protein HDU96_000125 [Phlyctochytrium bullatum]